MEFRKDIQEARFKSPLKGFEEVVQTIEVRYDPLTGRKCRINVERAKRPKQIPKDKGEIKTLVKSSQENCFFCSERLESSTPKFPDGLPERIRVGEACVFPNLFPFGGLHGVGIFSSKHFMTLDEISPKLIEDCFSASLQCFELFHKRMPELKFWYINWNNLPPGAASIVHPHLQILADRSQTSFLKELIERSRDYYMRTGENYWKELVQEEKRLGERYLGKTGRIHWLTTFAPSGNREVMGVVEDVSSLSGLREMLGDFSNGLHRILKGYNELGIWSITFTTFSGPAGEPIEEFYWLNTKMISRPYPFPFYVSDCGFMEKFHDETVIETLPEDISCLKKYFE